MTKFSEKLCRAVLVSIVIGWAIVAAGAGVRIVVSLFKVGWNVF